MNEYETGVSAVDALVASAVDVATGAEFVIVRKGFEIGGLRAFAQIANTGAIELIARKDRGIAEISDLKGIKVGLLRGSSSEFCRKDAESLDRCGGFSREASGRNPSGGPMRVISFIEVFRTWRKGGPRRTAVSLRQAIESSSWMCRLQWTGGSK
jgi:hypothetical protein